MTEQDFLRHLLATLAYRGGLCLRDAPEAFTAYDTGNGKTPGAILAHIGDLLEWTQGLVQGRGRWEAHPPLPWAEEVARFHGGLARLDAFLASGEPLGAPWTRLVQGPLADALTHVGQLALLRRMAGAPAPGESFYGAEITPGRVGPDQAPPRKPF